MCKFGSVGKRAEFDALAWFEVFVGSSDVDRKCRLLRRYEEQEVESVKGHRWQE